MAGPGRAPGPLLPDVAAGVGGLTMLGSLWLPFVRRTVSALERTAEVHIDAWEALDGSAVVVALVALGTVLIAGFCVARSLPVDERLPRAGLAVTGTVAVILLLAGFVGTLEGPAGDDGGALAPDVRVETLPDIGLLVSVAGGLTTTVSGVGALTLSAAAGRQNASDKA